MQRNIKRVCAGIAAGAVALSLAACGIGAPEPAVTELSDEPVTIRMTWWGGDGRHERTQQVIDLFEAEYPNITVEPEFSDWNGYWEKLATATAGKNAPDVIQMDQVYLASYANRGALAELSDYNIDTAGMEPSVLGMGESDGGQYAIPISTASTAVLVNTTLLDELGVPLPDNTDSWTWDEFADWAQQVTEASGGATYGASLMNNEFQLQEFIRQNGGELFDGTEVVVDPATLEAFFQQSLEWSKSGAAAPASVWAETATLPLDQLPLSVGGVATMFTSATLVSAYTASSGAEIDLVPLPTVSGGVEDYDYFKPGMYWAISSQSEHPVEAAALIDFFLNDPEAVKIIGTERGLPASGATLEVISSELTPQEAKAVDYSESRVPYLGEAPAIIPNGASDIEAILIRYLQDVLFERQTAAAAAKGMIAELQSNIDAAN